MGIWRREAALRISSTDVRKGPEASCDLPEKSKVAQTFPKTSAQTFDAQGVMGTVLGADYNVMIKTKS